MDGYSIACGVVYTHRNTKQMPEDNEPYVCPECGYSDPAGDQGQNCPNCDAEKD